MQHFNTVRTASAQNIWAGDGAENYVMMRIDVCAEVKSRFQTIRILANWCQNRYQHTMPYIRTIRYNLYSRCDAFSLFEVNNHLIFDSQIVFIILFLIEEFFKLKIFICVVYRHAYNTSIQRIQHNLYLPFSIRFTFWQIE